MVANFWTPCFLLKNSRNDDGNIILDGVNMPFRDKNDIFTEKICSNFLNADFDFFFYDIKNPNIKHTIVSTL